LPTGLKGLDADDSLSTFGSFRTLMTQPDPDPSTVAVRARQAATELDAMAEKVNRGQIPPGEVRAMLARSLKPEPAGQPLDWDGAARKYSRSSTEA
jgi:hypothetical protein